MKRFAYRVFVLLFCLAIIAAFTVAMGGCTNQTPRQIYRAEAGLYNASALGFAVARARGDVPSSVVKEVQPQLDDAAKSIRIAGAWISANPQLANVPGALPPELTLMRQAVDRARSIARRYIAKYLIGLPEFVPFDVDVPDGPPATQPASVAPVPIPIAG